MTREQAMSIRAAQLMGEPVKAIDLQAAIAVLSDKRSNTVRLPVLREEVRSHVNMVLMFNLGKALRA